MRHGHLRLALLAAAAAAALAACGGGGSGPASDDSTVPASAGASSQGFLDYVASLAGRMLDDREPADVGALSLPSDDADTREPAATSIDG